MTPDSKIRVLLVEDEQTLADIIADTLSEKDFTVTVAYNGIEGLRAFESERPQVVVTDIMMPGAVYPCRTLGEVHPWTPPWCFLGGGRAPRP